MAQAANRLGALLIARGWLDRTGLERALATQGVVGGHLGSCLLELDLISEERLCLALSQLLGVPAAGIEDLRNVREEVIKLIPRRLAIRHQAVPFRALGNQLDTAMVDTGNLNSRDELSFASGRRVNAYVAPEARVLGALEVYYQEECPPRFSRIIDRLNRSHFLWSEPGGQSLAAEAQVSDPEFELFPTTPQMLPPPILGAAPSGRRPAAPTPAPAPPPPTAPPAPTMPTALTAPIDIGARLATAGDRDVIGALVLSDLLRDFDRVGLFAVLRDRVNGWLGGGAGFKPDRLSTLSIPLGQPSAFLNLRQGSTLHLGPLAPMPAHRRLVECWGGGMPLECLLAPIRIGGRLVAVIYADRGAAPLGGVDLERIQLLASQAAGALERCIVLKKQRQSTSRRR
jgi:MshEN domain